jgi:hypothetical protein
LFTEKPFEHVYVALALSIFGFLDGCKWRQRLFLRAKAPALLLKQARPDASYFDDLIVANQVTRPGNFGCVRARRRCIGIGVRLFTRPCSGAITRIALFSDRALGDYVSRKKRREGSSSLLAITRVG